MSVLSPHGQEIWLSNVCLGSLGNPNPNHECLVYQYEWSGQLLSDAIKLWTLKAVISIIRRSRAPWAARVRAGTKAAEMGVGSIVSKQ